MPRVLYFSLLFLLLSLNSGEQSGGALAQSKPDSKTVNSPTSNPQSSTPAPAIEASKGSVDGGSPPPDPLGEARVSYSKGDFDHALEKYQQILKDRPQSPDAYAGMVRVYLKQKNVDGAAQTADKGFALTNSPRVRVSRAEVWFREGKIHEAEQEWAEVINSGSPEPRAYLGLARVREAVGNHFSAKQMVDRAHQLDPADPDVQEEWISTLSRSERIRYLQNSLSGNNAWDADERSDIANYLQYLKERASQHRSPCRLVSKVRATDTPLVRLLQDPLHLHGYGISVSLNGHKSDLMLDTGASGLLLDRSVAGRAGISKITETKVMGIGKKGRRDAYIGIADSIKIGELEFQNCPVEVMESRSVAGQVGLIGADVFEDFLVDIDFPKEKLRLKELPQRPGDSAQNMGLRSSEDDDSDDDENAEPTPDQKPVDAKLQLSQSYGPRDRYIAPEMRSYAGVFRFGHNLLIPTAIGSLSPKLFLIDTGALTNFISPGAAREVTKVHRDSDVIIEGISGRVDQVYRANKAVLTFDRLRQENQDITAFDTKPLSDSIGTEVSGFLGFTTLRMLEIKIDYRDNLVDFHYDADRWR